MKKVRKAVIPAAGLGTRFLPATKAQPKEMIPIVDKPTLQYIIEEAVSSGIEEILIITGRNKKSIEDHFDKSVELEMELEKKGKQELLEMVRGISNMVNIYSNIPCVKQLIDAYDKYQSSILGVQNVAMEDVDKYGIVEGEPIGNAIYKVNGLVEKPDPKDAPSDIAILGRYIITPAIFEILERTQAGRGGEIQLTDALKELSKSEDMYACVFDGRRYDVGDKMGYLEATIDFALKREGLGDRLLEYMKKTVEEKQLYNIG